MQKSIKQEALTSLCNLIQYSMSERTLKLKETKYNNHFSNQALSQYGLKLWNILLNTISDKKNTTIFNEKLKSYLMVNGELFHQKTVDY